MGICFLVRRSSDYDNTISGSMYIGRLHVYNKERFVALFSAARRARFEPSYTYRLARAVARSNAAAPNRTNGSARRLARFAAVRCSGGRGRHPAVPAATTPAKVGRRLAEIKSEVLDSVAGTRLASHF
jgi:hypothetical protein